MNEFSLSGIWSQQDDIGHAVVIVLLIMSVLSWCVIVLKAVQLFRLRRVASKTAGFWHARSLGEGLSVLGPQLANPFRALAEEGLDAVEHHRSNKEDLHGVLNLSDWIHSCLRRRIEESLHQMQAGLPILASVGSTSPFVGLFGTVWGIYHALAAIGASGQATLDKVAGPIGEALVMTAFGLVVAIPAVLGYNALVRGNRVIHTRLNGFAHDLHSYFITGARLRSEVPRESHDQRNINDQRVPM